MPKKSKTFKKQTVVFETKAAGKVMVTHEGKEVEAKECEVDLSTLDQTDPDGTIIATSTNPTCFWYLINGKWYWYCC